MAGRVFYTALLGFVAGVLFYSFFDFGLSLPLFAVLLSLALLFYYFISGRKSGAVFIIALALFSLGVGMFRINISDSDIGESAIDYALGENVLVKGIVSDEPLLKETSQQFVIDIGEIAFAGEEEEVRTRATVTADLYPRLSYGDLAGLRGELRKPESFETEEGQIFDYPAYLAKDNIYYQFFYPDVEIISSGNGNFIKEKLFSLKRAFLTRVGRVIPEPHASLLGGLVVGAEESLGDDLEEKFRDTGIIHIVVLSGYNVTIVAEGIMRFFSFLPSVFRTSLGVTGIVFFALMTGASATTVRASTMALLVILARVTGRTYDITRALLVAGFLMLLHNPKILVFDSSFQLSFAATVGLIYLSPMIEKRLGFVPSRWQLREFATATIATQLFVLPLLLVKTGKLSLVAVPVNLLVLGAVPITMLTGFLTGVVGFVSIFLSLPFGFITYALLAYILKVVDLFAALPFAAVSVPFFPVWFAVVTYAIYAILLYIFGVWRRSPGGG